LLLHYDKSKDRSEEFGWKKYCDEHVPTDKEQAFWGKVTIVFAGVMALIAIFL
jgi:hypothetical protein